MFGCRYRVLCCRLALAIFFFTLLQAVSSTHGAAQAPPTPSEGLVLPDRSLATQSDAASLEVNPAGLGFLHTSELSYGVALSSDDFRGVFGEGHALFLAAGTGGFGAGFGVQWLDQPELGGDRADYQKYTLALGVGGRQMSLGAGLNFFGSSTDERLNDLKTWDVGMQWRFGSYVGLGLLARDFNNAFLDEDEALPTRWGAALALRGWEGRVVLESEAARVRGHQLATLTPRLVLEPLSGLRIFGRSGFVVDWEGESTEVSWSTLSAGLELSMGNFGGQGAALFTDSMDNGFAHAGQSFRFWTSPNKQRSLYDGRGRWVMLDLDEGIAEQAATRLFGRDTRAFLSLLEDLDAISVDPSISGVVFRIGNMSLGYGQIWELRGKMEQIQAAGKHTLSVVSNAATRQIYLASAAGEVWMLPTITYSPVGLSAQFVSYQQALENLGVEAEFIRIGDYKSAPEAYIKARPSDEALEQTGSFLDALYSQLVTGIAAPRNLEPDVVVAMLNRVPLLPTEARAQGFIDDIAYSHEVENRLKERFGIASLGRGYRRVETAEQRWGVRPEIAVVYIDGVIMEGGSGRTPLGGDIITGSDTINSILRRLRDDNNVKAVVLRVDSPGGSAVGSDLIYRELRRVAERKPVIASMGNIAASGGYYVAAGADEIFATPTTLTGSIGIFVGKFNVERLARTIGVNHLQLTRGDRAGIYNIFEPWTADEQSAVARAINYMYRVFLTQVAQTRPLTADEVDSVGRGRVWTGAAAVEQRLVDRVGGLMEAIARAEELAGLEPRQANYQPYPGPISLFGGPLGVQVGQVLESVTPRLRVAPTDMLQDRSAAKQLLRSLESRALLPLLFAPGEALMLPVEAIVID